MKKIIIAILINFCFVNISISQTDRITGGFNLNIEESPWQVLLKIDDEYACGGSIIASRYILTAKHCCINTNLSDIKVIAGVTCKNDITSNNIFSVSEIILHPTLDVALLRLSKNIDFNDTKQPINFVDAVDTQYYTEGNNVRISGWGWLSPDGFNPSSCLQGVDVNIISNDDANQMLSDISGEVGENEMATTGVGTIRQGACHGDSGGPLTIWSDAYEANILLGVVSWGRANCLGNNSNSPSIFVRVSNIVAWIIENTCLIRGSSTICNQSTYTIENLPTGATVTWSTKNGKMQLISSGQETATFNPIGNNKEVIKAEINVSGHSYTIEKTVYINDFDIEFNLDDEICIQPIYHYSVPKLDDVTYSWKKDGVDMNTNQNQIIIASDIPEGTSTSFILKASISSDNCNLSKSVTVNYYKPTTKECYGWDDGTGNWGFKPFAIYPNPTSSDITVEFKEQNTGNTRTKLNTSYQIEIWRGSILLKTIKAKGEIVNINVSDLKKGFYYVLIRKDNKVYTQTFVKE